MSYIGPPCDVVHIHVLTVDKNMDLYVETPGTCQPEPIMCESSPNHCFPCIYVLKNHNKQKTPLVKPRTEKATGVDLRVPRSRVSQEKEPEIVGIPRKLACVHTICVQV